MDAVLLPIAESLGAPPSQLLLIILLILNVPLCGIMPRLPDPYKHLFSLIFSWVFLWPLLGLKWGYLQLLGQALISFAICKVAGRAYAQQKIAFPWPWLVFGACFAHLIGLNLYRYITDQPSDQIETSQMLMVLVQRVVLFAWTSYDRAIESASKKDKQPIVQEPPLPLLSYLGYCFFLPVFLAGPGIDYKSYRERTSAPLPPGRAQAAIRKTITGLIFVGLFAVLGPSFSYTKILDDSFLSLNPFMKLFFVNLAGFMARTKYYGVWLLAEASCISSGIGQTLPVDGDVQPWSHASNVDIGAIELAENWKMLLGAWNRWTNIWLRETIYIRVARANRKPGFKSTLVTFVVSALWHGVNPAYYATFVLGSFIQSLAKQMRRFVRPLVAEPPPPDSNKQQTAAQRENTISAYLFAKSVYDVLGSALTQCMVNYIVVPFVMLDMNSSIDAWRRVWFFGHWLTILPLLFFTLGGRIVLKSFAASRTAKAREPAPQTPTSDEPLLLGRDEDEELSEVVENKVDEQLRQRMPARRSEKEL